jgi:excisionase family DNA binding protein
MAHNRLDPSSVNPGTLEELSEVLAEPGHVSLVDGKGHSVALPAPLFSHLVNIVRLMAEERTIMLVPEDEECTTQAAADHLGVSRQHLVDLLEDGEIPFYRVGTHRRVKFRDLVDYEKRRDSRRRQALRSLADKVDEAGLYDASYTGEENGSRV